MKSKAWNGKDINKDEKNEEYNMDMNMLDHALVVISNLVARATTKWTLEETKLFLCAVSQIRTRDADNWVTLRKRDVAKKLGMKVDSKNQPKLREMFKRVVAKSYIQINGTCDDEWLDGVLLTAIKSTKYNISIRFNDVYVPLLDQLSSHFTEFYLDNVTAFSHMSSYNLYVYLCSWHDPNYLVQDKKIAKNDLHKIFQLKETDYWRNWGTDKAKFDWALFEKYVLNPAIEEINALCIQHKCDMYIDSCTKAKASARYVLGYDVKYSFVDKDGSRQVDM